MNPPPLRYTKDVSIGTRASKKIVFAGGGHAHLYSLLRTKELVRRGFEVTLVDASPHLYYSGMATGVISGVYGPNEHRMDVRRLVEEGGGAFVEGRVEEIRAEDREFVLEDGDTVPYDAASVCLGSEVPRNGFAQTGTDVVRVKPVEHTGEIRHRLLSFGKDRAPKILVAGGGAAGCEVAANTLALLDRLGIEGEVAIAERGGSLLPEAPEKAREQIFRFLTAKGARVLTNTLITSFDDGVACTRDGREILYDLLVLAVGTTPPNVFRASCLATGQDGGLWVDRNLRSVSDGRLFGGGDCISYRGEVLPKLGVFAVRQGPVLFHNLRAALEGEPFEPYKPQKRFLYILNLGAGTGLAIYGPLVWLGRLPFMLKHRIDEKFVSRYRG